MFPAQGFGRPLFAAGGEVGIQGKRHHLPGQTVAVRTFGADAGSRTQWILTGTPAPWSRTSFLSVSHHHRKPERTDVIVNTGHHGTQIGTGRYERTPELVILARRRTISASGALPTPLEANHDIGSVLLTDAAGGRVPIACRRSATPARLMAWL